MASYTKSQLKEGTPTEVLSGNKNFTLTNNSTGSVYFTIETIANNTGSFSDKSTNTMGVFSSFVGISEDSLVSSPYIASVILPEGESSFDFNPTVNVAVSSSLLRGTGEISLVIT